jgi:hypothetical protein
MWLSIVDKKKTENDVPYPKIPPIRFSKMSSSSVGDTKSLIPPDTKDKLVNLLYQDGLLIRFSKIASPSTSIGAPAVFRTYNPTKRIVLTVTRVIWIESTFLEVHFINTRWSGSFPDSLGVRCK